MENKSSQMQQKIFLLGAALVSKFKDTKHKKIKLHYFLLEVNFVQEEM